MNQEINDLAAKAEVRFFDYQTEFLTALPGLPTQRACLYYRTGAGKTITGLSGVALWGHDEAVVIAPPATHLAWEKWGSTFGIAVECMSHQKFRMKTTKLSRNKAIIADEFHMFGGHRGQGWKKLEALAKGLKAPMVLASATPNYNDADRVYCIQRILDPVSTKGGYLEFLYRHCNTMQNAYGVEPLVDDDQPFRNFKDAEEYLASLPGVFYVPDEVVYTITDIEYPEDVPWPMEVYGYNQREHRIIASQMEERHTRRYQGLVDEQGLIRDHVFEVVDDLIQLGHTPMLVYANHATVAEALGRSLTEAKVRHQVVTGSTTKKMKDAHIRLFKEGHFDVLVGTASLATGTDGLDKMCDSLVILDDTDDDALRRQLIGRIMPRGSDTDASKKQVYRLLPQ